jgi:hypothetical protein
MQQLGEIDRRTLIDLYLRGDQIKNDKPIPEGYSSLDWDNPNALDAWLISNRYKGGVVTGFRRWVLVQFTTEDLLNLAIIPDRFPEHPSQRLGDLVHLDWFKQPTRLASQLPRPWWEQHLEGIVAEEFPIICRPTTRMNRRHRTILWIEDGCGRTTLYLAGILRHNKPSQLKGYVGLDPDPTSRYLQTKFGGEFIKNAHKYQTLESALAAAKPSFMEAIGHMIGRARGRLV